MNYPITWKYPKLWWSFGILSFSFSTFFFLAPLPSAGEPYFPHIDKFIHFFIHLFLTSYFAALYQAKRSYLFFFSYGVIIELIQLQIHHRSFEGLDLIANATGDTIGYLFFWRYCQKAIKSIDQQLPDRST